MRFVCLGCLDKDAWGKLSAAEQQSLIAECTDFDKELYAQGHFAGGFALQDSAAATTLRWEGGKASLTDGPFAETKEMLGGILILEAKDKGEALRIMSRHPGIRIGPFEIRPADEAFMAQHPVLKQL
ncbi:MAG TPA: YciI family protein [Steroidobacteraceae bacterium]